MAIVSKPVMLDIFSVQLRRYRVERGLTQTDLGERANLHRTYISELENCRKTPSLQVVISLSDALQIEVWQLLYEETPAW